MTREDSIKLELEAEKSNHRRDNEYLLKERDELREQVDALLRALEAISAPKDPIL